MKSPGHLLIEEFKLAPGEEWTDEAKAWRFVRVSNGAAYWLDTARPRSFNAGEVVVIAPAAKALVRASQLNEVLLHGFGFVPDLLCGFFTLAERHFFESGEAERESKVRFLPSTHPVAQRFAALISQRGQIQPLAQRAELLVLSTAFFGEGMELERLAPTRGISAQQRFRQIVSQMPDLELIHHTPEQLASLCGCSPRHFNRLFRESFGEAPRARQAELRLLKASQLLGSTDAKIIEIALDSGYRSLSLFNSLFKRRFGMSPSEWRQQASREDTSSFRT